MDSKLGYATLGLLVLVAITGIGHAADNQPEPPWWNSTGANETALPGDQITIERTVGPVDEGRSRIIDQIEAPSSLNESQIQKINIVIVDDGGAESVNIDQENLTISMTWEPKDENHTAKYKFTVPYETAPGDRFRILSSVVIVDAEFFGEPDTIRVVEPTIRDYTNESGYVNRIAAVQKAFNHYQHGLIDELATVQELFQAYLEERPVES